jgi:hypothetical protein
MSSSSFQVDVEMSPEFARLDTCDSHLSKRWRGTAPPGGVPCSDQRSEMGRAAELMSIADPKFSIPCRERLNCPAFRATQFVIDWVAIGLICVLGPQLKVGCGEWAIRSPSALERLA